MDLSPWEQVHHPVYLFEVQKGLDLEFLRDVPSTQGDHGLWKFWLSGDRV
jgi:hypothetical protein